MEDSRGVDTAVLTAFLDEAPLSYTFSIDSKLQKTMLDSGPKPRQGFLLFFDLTNKYTLEQVKTVIEHIHDKMNYKVTHGSSPVPIVLVGNKKGLASYVYVSLI